MSVNVRINLPPPPEPIPPDAIPKHALEELQERLLKIALRWINRTIEEVERKMQKELEEDVVEMMRSFIEYFCKKAKVSVDAQEVATYNKLDFDVVVRFRVIG